MGIIVVTIDEILVGHIHLRNQEERTIRGCCQKIREDIRKGELLLCLRM